MGIEQQNWRDGPVYRVGTSSSLTMPASEDNAQADWEPWERICDYIRGVNTGFIIVTANSTWPNSEANLDDIVAAHNNGAHALGIIDGLEIAAQICDRWPIRCTGQGDAIRDEIKRRKK